MTTTFKIGKGPFGGSTWALRWPVSGGHAGKWSIRWNVPGRTRPAEVLAVVDDFGNLVGVAAWQEQA